MHTGKLVFAQVVYTGLNRLCWFMGAYNSTV